MELLKIFLEKIKKLNYEDISNQIAIEFLDILETYHLNKVSPIKILSWLDDDIYDNNQRFIKKLQKIVELALNTDGRQYHMFIGFVLNNIWANLMEQEPDEEAEDYLSVLDSYVESLKDIEKNSKDVLEEIGKSQQDIESFEQDINIKIEKQEGKIRDLIPQAITAVGIFVAALVFIIGGMNVVEALGRLENVPLINLAVLALFTGQVLFNCLFLLLYLLSRLSEKPIHSCCSKFEVNINIADYDKLERKQEYCDYCIRYRDDADQCSHARKIFSKYPHLHITNTFIFIAEIICLAILAVLNTMRAIDDFFLYIFMVALIVIVFCSSTAYILSTIGKIAHKKRKKKKKINYARRRIFAGLAASILISVFSFTIRFYCILPNWRDILFK
ncbi:MAG: hypothetical protein FWF85_02725 [Clostridiales bacterium]|nr:hypothetical protein [Clostridiales bacterium]